MKVFYDTDCDLNLLKNKKIAVMGFGSQGHAHAMNLQDSKLNVRVGLRAGSASQAKAAAAGLTVMPLAEAAAWADTLMMLLPDETQSEVYQRDIAPHMKAGKTLLFAHGFNIHFKMIEPPKNVSVAMVAPKGPGHMVRDAFTKNSGVPALVAIHQDGQGHALAEALAYAKGIGAGRAGILQTTFREETETDLFGEQVVLCGGLTALIKAGFETLVDAGYSAEMAYFECLHEVKLIVDLLYQGGITDMRYSISNTAQFGDITRGPRIVTDATRAEMKKILGEIQRGEFAKEWMNEYRGGLKNFKALTEKDEKHAIETVGKKLRAMMPWLNQNRLVDRQKN